MQFDHATYLGLDHRLQHRLWLNRHIPIFIHFPCSRCARRRSSRSRRCRHAPSVSDPPVPGVLQGKGPGQGHVLLAMVPSRRRRFAMHSRSHLLSVHPRRRHPTTPRIPSGLTQSQKTLAASASRSATPLRRCAASRWTSSWTRGHHALP